MSQATKARATGRIEVDGYDPQPYEEPAVGPQLVEIHVSERFVGDIEGDGVVRFLQATREDGELCRDRACHRPDRRSSGVVPAAGRGYA
ncbi:MAG: hypothetical protein ACLP01_28660 [Solirubrobacteraceae bacterium]